MAITFSGVQTNVTSSTSVTVTTPTAPGGGSLSSSNVIFAIIGVAASLSEEWAGYAAAGWNRVFWEPGSASRLHVLWRQATASEPANYTFGAYTSAICTYGVMFSCAGINTTTPVNTSASDFGASVGATAVCPSVSPTTSNTMLFWCALLRANVTTTSTTASSTGTELFDLNGGTFDSGRGVMAGYYEQLSAIGSTGTRTVTITQNSGSRGMGTLALNPASSFSFTTAVSTSSTTTPVKQAIRKASLTASSLLAPFKKASRAVAFVSSQLFKPTAKFSVKSIPISSTSAVSAIYGSIFSRAFSVLTDSTQFVELVPGKVMKVLSGSLPAKVIKSAISSRVITTVQAITPFKKSTKKTPLSGGQALARSMLGTAHVPNTMEWVSNTPTTTVQAGFPQVAATNSGNQVTDTTTHTINLPTGITAGDLLLAFIVADESNTLPAPTGWTSLNAHASSSHTLRVSYKIATGSEGATVTTTTDAAQQSAHITYRITGWHGTTPPEISSVATGTGPSPDPPSLNPSAWDVEDTLWIALAAWDASSSWVSDPTGWSGNSVHESIGTSTGVGIAAVTKNEAAASQNPSWFTISSGNLFKAYTIAVRPAAAAYVTEVLADSPVGYWRLGEASGAVANDETANSLDGTYINTPTLGVSGIVSGNTAVLLNGTSQYVTVADANALDLTGDWTIEAWIKRTSATSLSAIAYIVDKGTSQYGLGLDANDKLIGRLGGATQVTGTTSILDTNWHHVAVVKSGTTYTLYLDSNSDGSATVAGTPAANTNPVGIGASQSGALFFPGSLDEVAIYPTALPQARVQAHYDAAIAGIQVIVTGSPPYEMKVPRGACSPGDLLIFTIAHGSVINFSTVPSGWIEVPDTPHTYTPVGLAPLVYLKSYYKIAEASEPSTYGFWSSISTGFSAGITVYSNPRATLTQVGERSIYSSPAYYGAVPVLPGIPYAESSALLVRTVGTSVRTGTPTGPSSIAPPTLYAERWENHPTNYLSGEVSDRFVAYGSAVPASTNTLSMDVTRTTWKKSNSSTTYGALVWASDDTTSTTATISRSKSSTGDFTAHSATVLWNIPRSPTPSYPNDTTFVNAKVKFHVRNKTDDNTRNLVLVWTEQSNNSLTGWVPTAPVAGDDTFIAKIPISDLVVGQVNEIPIPDEWLNRIFTYASSTSSSVYYVPMSLAISGGTPGAVNSVVIATEEHTTNPAPSLELVYTQLPSVPRVIAGITPPNLGLSYEWAGQTIAFAPSTHDEFTRFAAFNVVINSIPVLKKSFSIVKAILSVATTGLQKTRFVTRSLAPSTQALSFLKSSTRTVSLSTSQTLSGIFRGLYLKVFSLSNSSTTSGLFQTVKAHVAIIATSSTIAVKRGFFMFNDIATASTLSVLKASSRIRQMSATHSLSFVEVRHILKAIATGSTTAVLKTMSRIRGLTNGWTLLKIQSTTLHKAITSSSTLTMFKSLVYWLIGRRGI